MNDHKFAFIICTNNDIYLKECLTFIDRLFIPEGYEKDVLCIRNAACITEGYQEGMRKSDAKYKVYLHQDVFITNRYFLFDVLTLFAEDTRIGMIGMVGYQTLSDTGFMWDEKPTGTIPLYGLKGNYMTSFNEYRYDIKEGYTDVAVIDGFMMITAIDLDWNTKRLRDWDFYDAYQCMNFLEHGYRIIVPTPKMPWFVHDDGFILSMHNYKKYRDRFMEDFSFYLGKSCQDILARTAH